MKYTVEIMMNFTDIHDNSIKYIKGQKINVSEKRALELFSSDYHLVKFVTREEENDNLDDQKNVGVESDNQESSKDNSDNQTVNDENKILESSQEKSNKEEINTDDLDSMNFAELQKLATERGLDITLANSKDKLRTLIRTNQ